MIFDMAPDVLKHAALQYFNRFDDIAKIIWNTDESAGRDNWYFSISNSEQLSSEMASIHITLQVYGIRRIPEKFDVWSDRFRWDLQAALNHLGYGDEFLKIN